MGPLCPGRGVAGTAPAGDGDARDGRREAAGAVRSVSGTEGRAAFDTGATRRDVAVFPTDAGRNAVVGLSMQDGGAASQLRQALARDPPVCPVIARWTNARALYPACLPGPVPP